MPKISELLGKNILFSVNRAGHEGAVHEGKVEVLSPSGKYAVIGFVWHEVERVNVLEVLPDAAPQQRVVELPPVAPPVEEVAKNLYTAYCQAVGGKAFNGDPLPAWPDFALDAKKQTQVEAWRAVAKASLCPVMAAAKTTPTTGEGTPPPPPTDEKTQEQGQ